MTRPSALIVSALLAILLPRASNGEEAAKKRLEDSPRHHEWVPVKAGEKTIHSYLVFPEVKDKAMAVVVIHENRGLTDWVRGVADRLAEAGYIAIAPDLLSGMGPKGGKTSDFPDADAARDAIYKLTPEGVTAALQAVSDHAAKLPASNGKVAVAGFCWGGAQSFRFAGSCPDLAAAFVFYGTGPDSKDGVEKIGCPVYGFYGGDDARVNSTIPKTAELMKAAGKTFEPETYDGAGHGFLRAGEEANASEANKKAHAKAWARMKTLLEKAAKASPAQGEAKGEKKGEKKGGKKD